MNLLKLHAELAAREARQAEQLAFLVMSGSFNPVHTQHIRAMEIARNVVTRLGWCVIGGFLAPSDDEYVTSKVGSDAWSLERRIELCRLATEDSRWVDATPWAEFSSFRAVHRLQRIIEADCREGLNSRPLTGIMVMGSDTAVRILRRVLEKCETSTDDTKLRSRDPADWICCLARPGLNGTAEMEEITRAIRPRVAVLGINIVVSGNCSEALLDVSSQAIRNAIRRKEWNYLIEHGWMNEKVLARLRSTDR